MGDSRPKSRKVVEVKHASACLDLSWEFRRSVYGRALYRANCLDSGMDVTVCVDASRLPMLPPGTDELVPIPFKRFQTAKLCRKPRHRIKNA